jgi:subtilisin-like proprotein convertase family protein
MDARSFARWIVVILAAASCSEGLAATVHTYSGDFDLRIPAEIGTTKGWMEDAVIVVPDHLVIEDLDVCISIIHSKVFDLQILLKSPAGTTMLLNMYDPFTEYFEGQDYSGTVFDDEAAVPIEAGKAPFAGRFRPKETETLSVFDGQDTYGPWFLQVYDAFYADVGSLKQFELIVTVPEPDSAVLFLLGGAALLTVQRVR